MSPEVAHAIKADLERSVARIEQFYQEAVQRLEAEIAGYGRSVYYEGMGNSCAHWFKELQGARQALENWEQEQQEGQSDG